MGISRRDLQRSPRFCRVRLSSCIGKQKSAQPPPPPTPPQAGGGCYLAVCLYTVYPRWDFHDRGDRDCDASWPYRLFVSPRENTSVTYYLQISPTQNATAAYILVDKTDAKRLRHVLLVVESGAKRLRHLEISPTKTPPPLTTGR